MDVADLLVQPPASETWAAWLIAGTFVLAVVAVGIPLAAVIGKKKRVRAFIAGSLLGVLAITSAVVATRVGNMYHSPNHTKVLEARLFENYGFTYPDLTWRRIENSGSNGLITTMKRDGDKFTVKVTLEGTRLSLVGTDGREIPAHNQAPESSN